MCVGGGGDEENGSVKTLHSTRIAVGRYLSLEAERANVPSLEPDLETWKM